MGKLLRLRDYILISAAAAGEIFEEVRLVGGFLPSAMLNRYGFIPEGYKRKSYLTEVSEMLSVGDIERKVDKQGQTYIILASAGKNNFKRKFRVLCETQKWDGYFMIVIFDIPERERRTRDQIRAKLYDLGFAMLQESVWICPYHFEEDLREFFENHALADKVFVLSAKKILAGKINPLVEKIWKLRELNDRYKDVINKVNIALQGEGKKRKKLIYEAFKIYLETFSTDPHLPKKLLPKYWLRETALNLLNKHFTINLF